MEEITFTAKPNVFSPEMVYQLADDGLAWSGGGKDGRLLYTEIVQIRLFGSPKLSGRGNVLMPAFTTGVLRSKSGVPKTLSSLHYCGVGQIEDRSASFSRLIDALLPRVAAANPSAVFLSGMPTGLWSLWIGVLLVSLSATVLGLAIVVNGATRQDWGDLVIGVVMVLLFGFSTWRLFPIVAHGRARQFRPGDWPGNSD